MSGDDDRIRLFSGARHVAAWRARVERFGWAVPAIAVLLLPGPWGPTRTPGPLHPLKTPSSLDDGLDLGTPSRLVSGDPGHGAQLFQELDCVRCHVEPRTGTGVNIPAALRDAGSRSRAEWIEAYLLEPRPLRYVSEDRRPERIMPALVTRPEDARDLAALLSTWRDTVRVPETSNRLGPAKNEDRRQEGRMLFEQYQCLGCHEFGGDGGHVGPALDGVGSRRRPAFVLAMLEHPDRVVPGTAMEDKKLWDSEAEAITTYLMNLQSKR